MTDFTLAATRHDKMEDTSNDTMHVDEYDYSERPETYIVPILFAFIFFIGTVGNGSLVLIFFRHKHMINVPNIYILSLALGDLLVLLSSIPFTSTVYTVIGRWPPSTIYYYLLIIINYRFHIVRFTINHVFCYIYKYN